ncbi:uncharacterized protein Z519_05792 [Cladophialophora bantiana CBS 173.52]|uniref:TOG domain-containing protein n=1 Tax=Cladophialophora bantiana (strain ATCC 10958 / CBS 173.52 / CDC B-1940 / NIH 8579) TaxID=1442370 RepID=A0A0D2G3B6_CLAB1|nr:uncharacterized protein Z519_05792 [Cladophialophora bantiana CBS 173.52]KIW93187.1 hypothetical protein Z519_05792 [Cladophialophora bantiana CBS 173.52]
MAFFCDHMTFLKATTANTFNYTAKKVNTAIPAIGKAVYFAIAGARAKMLGKTYADVLNFLHYEFTLPETEESWKKRQDLLAELSDIFEKRKENSAIPNDFVQKVKAVLPHIVTTAGSERTTLSAQACRALSNIAKHLETQIQPQLDLLLSGLIVICGSTKTVNQKNANDAIVNICKHAGYSPRLFYHVCSAFKDNRIPPRTYAPEWLRILIETYRTQMDREKDAPACEKAILQGLTDGQVKVRENSRAAFWTFHSYDPRGARNIMNGLNTHAQKALKADPHNPDKSSATAAQANAVPRPKSALASIKAQNKERMAQSQESSQQRGLTPEPIKSDDFKLFGTMEDVEKKPSLLSAPVRRRIVATPMPSVNSVQRPESRGRAVTSASSVSKDNTINVVPESVLKSSYETIKSDGKENALKSSYETIKSDGKENAMVIRPRKKRSPKRSPRRSPERDGLASEKKTLLMAMEALRRSSLDALGYRRLRKLIEENPGVLITKHSQFNELFELLINNMVSLDMITESRDKRATNLNHPAYNTHTILITLVHLFQQYPQWPEPQPGMTLSALLIARCNHSSSYASVLSAIDDGAFLLCSHTQTVLPTIDAVLDTLEQIEYIITTNDPIVTPKSTDTIFYNSLQSLASEFGPEKSRFANRLPIIMDFGLKILNALLIRLVSCNETLYEIQEDRLAAYAEHLLASYTSIIKRAVMNFCINLHAVIKPEARFYKYFKKESDKNLIHYYVDVAGTSY